MSIIIIIFVLSEKHVTVQTGLKAGELVASWVVSVGDQDQVIHIWKYTGGYAGVDNAVKALKESPVRISF